MNTSLFPGQVRYVMGHIAAVFETFEGGFGASLSLGDKSGVLGDKSQPLPRHLRMDSGQCVSINQRVNKSTFNVEYYKIYKNLTSIRLKRNIKE